jgi:hypothetical protein
MSILGQGMSIVDLVAGGPGRRTAAHIVFLQNGTLPKPRLHGADERLRRHGRAPEFRDLAL